MVIGVLAMLAAWTTKCVELAAIESEAAQSDARLKDLETKPEVHIVSRNERTSDTTERSKGHH